MQSGPKFDFDREEPREMWPLDRPRPPSRLRLLGHFVVAAAIIAGLTMAARDRLQHSRTTTIWTEPSRPDMASHVRDASSVDGTGPLLRLDASRDEASAHSEPPRWNAATGSREDAVSSGSFAAIEAPFLRVTLGELQADAEPAASLFVALARRAAEVQGLSVVRTGLRGRIASKFGAFETVEAVLSAEGRRSCVGFRSLEAPHLLIDGWLCGILGQAPQPQEVSCLIDRLALAGLAAPTVEATFAQAERHRGAGCAESAAVDSREADRTGSIAGREVAKGRSRKNEAGMRQSD